MPTETFVRSPCSVISPSVSGIERSAASSGTTSSRRRSTWFGRAPGTHAKLRRAAGPRRGCATQPAAGVERTPVVAKLIEDLLHLERREDRLDQDGAADRPAWDPELVLRGGERLRPEPRLEMRLQLRQVEVRPAAAVEQLARVVER